MTSHSASAVEITRVVVAAVFAIAVSTPASFAQISLQEGEIPKTTVRYADLNLSTEEGARALYSRLIAAAQKVCPTRADTLLALKQIREVDRCVTETVQRAVKEIKDPKFAEGVAARMR